MGKLTMCRCHVTNLTGKSVKHMFNITNFSEKISMQQSCHLLVDKTIRKHLYNIYLAITYELAVAVVCVIKVKVVCKKQKIINIILQIFILLTSIFIHNYLPFTFIYFGLYKRTLHNHNIFTFSLNKNIPCVTPLHVFIHMFYYSSSLIIYLPRTLTTTVV